MRLSINPKVNYRVKSFMIMDIDPEVYARV